MRSKLFWAVIIALVLFGLCGCGPEERVTPVEILKVQYDEGEPCTINGRSVINGELITKSYLDCPGTQGDTTFIHLSVERYWEPYVKTVTKTEVVHRIPSYWWIAFTGSLSFGILFGLGVKRYFERLGDAKLKEQERLDHWTKETTPGL